MNVTMKQIAEKTGVSINAVSLALNGKKGVSDAMRRKIMQTAAEMGYIAQNERYHRASSYMNICVMMKKEYYSINTLDFYPRVLYGIEKAARANGYDVVLSIIDSKRSMPAVVEERRVCGIIVLGSIEDSFLARVQDTGLPVILVDHASPALAFDCIMTDNRFGTMEAARFLFQAGYRKIGFFGDFSYSNSNRERFFGYQEAMLRFGGGTYAERMQDVFRYSILENIEPMIQQRNAWAVAKILEKAEALPEAYQCSNDTAAFVLNNALGLLHYRVPEDIAVIGFDDKSIATMMMPPLTTLHVANDRMGQKAVQKLLWRLENPRTPMEKVMMEVELVVRGSTRLPEPSAGLE